MARFALFGAAGFVAPRHLQAIHATGNTLAAAVDPHDAVGVLDRFFPDARFFTEVERFDRHLEKLRRGGEGVEIVSVCSPNYLHDAHVRMALRMGADAICEKPLVINPWNLDALAALEAETGRRVYTVLQLRHHPAVLALRDAVRGRSTLDVDLVYVTRRGRWYDVSWKGSAEKSGGLLMNIGVHFFDLLLWLFGRAGHVSLTLGEGRRMAGELELERARVRWFLSVEETDLPDEARRTAQPAHRRLRVGDQEVDLGTGFQDLHTEVYREVLAGRGYGVDDARPSIELVHRLRHTPVEEGRSDRWWEEGGRR